MNEYNVTGIYVYPIKSLGRVKLSQTLVESRGLRYDRRWVLIDDNNKFMTQREHEKMALVKVYIHEKVLKLTYRENDADSLLIPFGQYTNQQFDFKIWDKDCSGNMVGEEYNEWFTKVLGVKCKLMYMNDNIKRLVNSKHALNGEIVGYTDGYPVLVLGEESMAQLNSKLDVALPINRFRPNITFCGGQPHDEDSWKEFSIGQSEFYTAKPCVRCKMTTIDQDTAEMGKEPLKTLATYRKADKGVIFGSNVIIKNGGHRIQVGDKIKVTN